MSRNFYDLYMYDKYVNNVETLFDLIKYSSE